MATQSNLAVAYTLATPEEVTDAPLLKVQQLSFTGTGSEYFRIWIVNLLFTILTLGIYSAWAKVRKLRYFYAILACRAAALIITAIRSLF